MTDAQARARVWTLCLYALVLAALTSPVVGLLAPLARASAPALNVVAAALAAVLVGAYVVLPSYSSPPSCASCGLVWTATLSPCGSAVLALWRNAASPSRGLRSWRYFGTMEAPTGLGSWYQRASKRSTIRSSSSKGMELR